MGATHRWGELLDVIMRLLLFSLSSIREGHPLNIKQCFVVLPVLSQFLSRSPPKEIFVYRMLSQPRSLEKLCFPEAPQLPFRNHLLWQWFLFGFLTIKIIGSYIVQQNSLRHSALLVYFKNKAILWISNTLVYV